MRYVDEFRDGRHARAIASRIHDRTRSGRNYRLMEFCGGHTHAISRFGLESLLPSNVQLIHGPGCPVCVLPTGRLEAAVALARTESVILCTYGDMLRVPCSDGVSLQSVRAEGADVRMVYSVVDALEIARREPNRRVVFFAIGFETTTPPTAVALLRARSEGLGNFSVYCNHVLTPPALEALLDDEATSIDGYIGPAHVSTIIGSRAYDFVAERYERPIVIAGFEPVDVIQSIGLLIDQLNEGRCEVENQFTRAVTRHGNQKAQQLMAEVFEPRETFEWRGLGEISRSALRPKGSFAAFDAERVFEMEPARVSDPRACECAAVLRGAIHPSECKVFGTACTPQTPIGACMVSSEGACAAYYTYQRAS
jgi:hydrogenase expression/formation protein HypD